MIEVGEMVVTSSRIQRHKMRLKRRGSALFENNAIPGWSWL